MKHVIAIALLILFYLFAYALSWISTVGIIKLITLCFGWSFSWAIATGIWLVLVLATPVFKSARNNREGK